MAGENKIKVSEILRHLRSRVEDETDLGFTLSQKYDALDTAQRYICTIVHNYYLKNLETQEVITTDGDGNFEITGLTNKVFRSDILNISTLKNGHIHTLDKIESNDVSRLSNTYLSGDLDYQMWYQFANKVYIYPLAEEGEFTVQYIKEPTLFYDDTSLSTPETCDLDMILIDALLDFSEAHLWKIDNKPNRVKLAFEIGQSNIQLLNNRFAQERTTGVGQVGKGNQ
tara:strand:+ start:5451 stop:6131 length:681 start_codon:yes stop_codon:yes gene_type:complete